MSTASRADPTSLVTGLTGIQANSAANFAALPGDRSGRSYGAASGCLGVDGPADAGPSLPSRWGELACSAAAPSTPHELKIDRGAASWRLGISGGDPHNLGEIRSAFSLEHFLTLGPLGGWRLHGDLWLGRPTIVGSGFPIDERTHVWMSRGLPLGWNLRLAANATAQGALDPGAAGEQDSEVAAELTRSFRFAAPEADHKVTLKLAEQDSANRQFGTDQRTTLAGLTYGHALTAGSLSASLTYTHAEPIGSPSQSAARAELKFSHKF
jgi:hypothetical protein